MAQCMRWRPAAANLRGMQRFVDVTWYMSGSAQNAGRRLLGEHIRGSCPVSVYDGSWPQRGADERLPIETGFRT